LGQKLVDVDDTKVIAEAPQNRVFFFLFPRISKYVSRKTGKTKYFPPFFPFNGKKWVIFPAQREK
jgi:hypothetical protein